MGSNSGQQKMRNYPCLCAIFSPAIMRNIAGPPVRRNLTTNKAATTRNPIFNHVV